MPAAWEHLGLKPPEDTASESLWSLLPESTTHEPHVDGHHDARGSYVPQEDTEGMLFFDDGD